MKYFIHAMIFGSIVLAIPAFAGDDTRSPSSPLGQQTTRRPTACSIYTNRQASGNISTQTPVDNTDASSDGNKGAPASGSGK